LQHGETGSRNHATFLFHRIALRFPGIAATRFRTSCKPLRMLAYGLLLGARCLVQLSQLAHAFLQGWRFPDRREATQQ
jgi:hypothetical protein